MADWTSNGTGGGNWNSASTWTAGSGYPNADTDTFTIVAGDTVTVNGSYPASGAFGTSTVNGTLSFSRSANSKLTMGHVGITMGSAGHIDMGTTTSPIPNAYTAELVWATTGNLTVININSSGPKITCCGDPVRYGSTLATQIADNPNVNIAASGSDSFTTTEDMSLKWLTGNYLLLHKGDNYASYVNDFALVSIDSFSGTTVNCTIVSNPGGAANFLRYGDVLNLGRNVKIYKSGLADTLGSASSNTPNFTINYPGSYFKHCELHGVGGAISNTVFDGAVLRNTAITNVNACDIDDCIVCNHPSMSCSYKNTTVDDSFFCCNGWYFNGFNPMLTNCSIFGHSQTSNFPLINIVMKNCYLYSMQYLNKLNGILESCVIGKDRLGNVKTNDYDLVFDNGLAVIFRNCDLPSSLSKYFSNSATYGVDTPYYFEYYDQTTTESHQRIINSYGEALRVVADNADSRPNGNHNSDTDAYVYEIITYSNCGALKPFQIHSPHKPINIYAEAGVEKTFKFYVQTDYASPGTGVKLYASYLDGVSNGSRTIATNSPSLTTRSNSSDWNEYASVTITPGEDGFVSFWFEVSVYESSKYFWLDPLVEIS